MIDKKVIEDPFMGVSIGSLVKIKSGPSQLVDQDALVVSRYLATSGDEESIEEYEANVEVLVGCVRTRLWIGWVERILD